MNQLVFDFYKKMAEKEMFIELSATVIIDACYEKKKYPRALEDITKEEFKDVFGESIYLDYKENEEQEKGTMGHLVILKEYKRDGKFMSIKRLILDNSKNDYQSEMIADIVGGCLVMPDELLGKYIVEQKTVKRIAQIFRFPESGVKLRLIKYYYDNVVKIIEKCEEKAKEIELFLAPKE